MEPVVPLVLPVVPLVLLLPCERSHACSSALKSFRRSRSCATYPDDPDALDCPPCALWPLVEPLPVADPVVEPVVEPLVDPLPDVDPDPLIAEPEPLVEALLPPSP